MSPESIRREAVTRILTQVTNTLADSSELLETRVVELLTNFPRITFEEAVTIIVRRIARQDLLKELT